MAESISQAYFLDLGYQIMGALAVQSETLHEKFQTEVNFAVLVIVQYCMALDFTKQL